MPMGPFGVISPIAGHWHADVSANDKLADTPGELDIEIDGRYRFRGETREKGLWETADGKWTRKPQGAPPETGKYEFDGLDTVTTTGASGTTIWKRAD